MTAAGNRYDFAWWASPTRAHAVAAVPDRRGDPVLIHQAGRWLTLCGQGPARETDLRPIVESTAPICRLCLTAYDELALTRPRSREEHR